jgi:small subunit ribosomal protein S16
MGLKGQPTYRIVVTDRESPRDGKYIEIIGFYNPRTNPATVTYEEDRALYWLSRGAQPSEAVERFFQQQGTRERLARLMKGEEMATLVAEAQAAAAARPVVRKTGVAAPTTNFQG